MAPKLQLQSKLIPLPEHITTCTESGTRIVTNSCRLLTSSTCRISPAGHTPLNGISLTCSGRGMGYKSLGCKLFGLKWTHEGDRWKTTTYTDVALP
jgi:hypothetical protein